MEINPSTMLRFLRGGTGNNRPVRLRNSSGCPERALLAAIMIRAIQDYTRMHVKNRYASKMVSKPDTGSAAWWIFEEESQGPFSFEWICEHLDLDPAKCRRRIYTLRELSRATGSIHRSSAYRPDLTNFMLARPRAMSTIEVVAL